MARPSLHRAGKILRTPRAQLRHGPGNDAQRPGPGPIRANPPPPSTPRKTCHHSSPFIGSPFLATMLWNTLVEPTNRTILQNQLVEQPLVSNPVAHALLRAASPLMGTPPHCYP